ncbi:16S rRNA (cytidine(1402)-2'-O)-methyltransferase [Candidatus Curtissbacteria bacterium RIFCSPHIGHO2_01_FULL_41_11]|uniref:Ribosomal RNA small subunit methyltransferase I n=1 Tax=Candidatus Curtissbacteria bacterium RIFCSPHIGHO2_01_FULL_41_11 TaxID=1797711 RepID=A0A1F5G854_9BACT|nr:MAG: 16S rRNA (cytidine(1402)-2'-O)-methyltransferase [Candidatus Curtissbacteria bacterium RIFCSPHIGHO2_01_FULL_41_11]
MGVLYIVATPIGNLKDITLRAVETLKAVDLVVCEDTRVFGKLANEYGVDKPTFVLNDFNEAVKVDQLIKRLQDGDNLALVSDAGTPLVSDPGFKLVREAVAGGVKVESIPGPTAAIAALTVSGLPCDKFMFVGYLSKKDGQRKTVLMNLKSIREILKTTFIIYESPFRLVKTLESIKEVFGDIEVVICRELTKMHEETRREKISACIQNFLENTPKGEFILLL